MAARLATAASGNTFLRMIRSSSVAFVPSLRIIGVDDCAW